MAKQQHVEKWGTFEVDLRGPVRRQPVSSTWHSTPSSPSTSREVRVPGFYDGDGIYRVRFMPDTEGEWTFATRSKTAALDGKIGAFQVRPRRRRAITARSGRATASTSPMPTARRIFSFGTTCYAWTHQPLEMQAADAGDAEEDALQQDPHGRVPEGLSLQRQRAAAPGLPSTAPTARTTSTDQTRSLSGISRSRSAALRDLGIEADIILFHPYDRWGYCRHVGGAGFPLCRLSRRAACPPTATSGGRSPTSTTSCSTPSRWRSGTATSTSSRRTIPTGT